MLVASLCNNQRKGTTSSGGSSLFKSVSLKTLIAEVPAAEGKASSVLADEAAPRMIEVMKSSGEQKGGASAIGESLDVERCGSGPRSGCRRLWPPSRARQRCR